VKKEAQQFQTFDFFSFLWKYRKPILIITLAGIILSVVISLLIKPRYASEVILYPSGQGSVSRALISTREMSSQNNILQIGDEEETERLLQILYSDRIRNRLIQKFKLFEHYNIKPESKYKYTQLNEKMKKNISFHKTEYMAIRIRVLDTDPKIAARMANDIASLLDSTVNMMQKRKAVEAFLIVKSEYRNLQREISVIEDSLRTLGKLGVFDVLSQSQGLQEAYLMAIEEGKTEIIKKLGEQMVILGKYGSNYLHLKELLINESDRLSLLKEKYTETKIDAEQNLPHTFLVKRGEIPEKKAVPKRSLIVIAATLSVFLFAVVLLLIIEAIKNRTD